MPNPRAFDLGFELEELRAATDAARLLLEVLVVDGAPNEEHARRTPAAAEAVLTLVGLRLRDLGRVLRRELDPGLLVGDHNRALPGRYPNGIVLAEWNESEVSPVPRRPRTSSRRRTR